MIRNACDPLEPCVGGFVLSYKAGFHHRMGESVESTCQILDVLLIKLRACGDDEFDDLRKETEKAARHHLPVDLSMLYEARIMRLVRPPFSLFSPISPTAADYKLELGNFCKRMFIFKARL